MVFALYEIMGKIFPTDSKELCTAVLGRCLTSCDMSFRVMVKMKNLLNGNTWLWERGKFMNRRYMMQVNKFILFY